MLSWPNKLFGPEVRSRCITVSALCNNLFNQLLLTCLGKSDSRFSFEQVATRLQVSMPCWSIEFKLLSPHVCLYPSPMKIHGAQNDKPSPVWSVKQSVILRNCVLASHPSGDNVMHGLTDVTKAAVTLVHLRHLSGRQCEDNKRCIQFRKCSISAHLVSQTLNQM